MLWDDHFQQVVQCFEGESEWEKTAFGAKVTYIKIEDSNSILILGIPVTILGTTETSAHFMKKPMHLKTVFC